jgi:hypothetical protein
MAIGTNIIYIVAIWYIYPRLGILNKETSGIPGVLQCGHSAFHAFG